MPSSFAELNSAVTGREVERGPEFFHAGNKTLLDNNMSELAFDQPVDDQFSHNGQGHHVGDKPLHKAASGIKVGNVTQSPQAHADAVRLHQCKAELAHPHPKRPMRMVELWDARQRFEAVSRPALYMFLN